MRCTGVALWVAFVMCHQFALVESRLFKGGSHLPSSMIFPEKSCHVHKNDFPVIAGISAVQKPPRKSLKEREIHLGLLMFLFYASLGSLLPYLPVFYRRLGLGGWDFFVG